jgi:hypothetical protein
MRDQFEHELERSVNRIKDAIAPYTRFVRSSREQLIAHETDLTGIESDLRTLRHQIGTDPALPAKVSSS